MFKCASSYINNVTRFSDRLHQLLIGLILAVAVVICSSSAGAASDARDKAISEKTRQDIQAVLKPYMGRETELGIRFAPVKGFYEVVLGTSIIYLSEDLQHVMQGDLIHLATRTNITAQSQESLFKQRLAKIDPSELVVFKARDEKYRVKVFTDVDCGYCRKLHREIDSYLQAGITIQYLAFPRNGLRSETFTKMKNVWCAKDRNKAMTRAKQDSSNPRIPCSDPVAKHYELGKSLGINGTPTIFSSEGKKLPGYVNAQQLLSFIQN